MAHVLANFASSNHDFVWIKEVPHCILSLVTWDISLI